MNPADNVRFRLYPEAQPYDSGFYDTGDGHSLNYARYGNPNGRKAVYLHGGPGGGCSFDEYRWFDPEHFDILIFDQRGAGKSTPYASVENNSIDLLVDDLENLRRHFKIKSWSVCGGSWGSALAMFYAVRHPEYIERMLLRGIFFADPSGADHVVYGHGGPDLASNPYYIKYVDFVSSGNGRNDLIQSYYNLMTSNKNIEASRLFAQFNTSLAFYETPQALIDEISAHPEDEVALKNIWFHFCMHEFKIENRDLLLNGMSRFRNPVEIIHGRQDYICPAQNAVDLDAACPNSRVQIFDKAGHAQREDALLTAFIQITESWKEKDRA